METREHTRRPISIYLVTDAPQTISSTIRRERMSKGLAETLLLVHQMAKLLHFLPHCLLLFVVFRALVRW